MVPGGKALAERSLGAASLLSSDGSDRNTINAVHTHQCRNDRSTSSGRRNPRHLNPLSSFQTHPHGRRTDRGFSSSSFERLGIQLHRAPTLEGTLSVFLWACLARGSGDASRRSAIVVATPPRPRSHMLSDFISSPHSPFKSLIRLLLRHIVAGRLPYIAPCRHLQPGGSWGTTCARHGAAYTVWRARAVDGSYGGDVHASRGWTSLCTVVRMPCWSPALAGRSFVAHGSAAAAALRP